MPAVCVRITCQLQATEIHFQSAFIKTEIKIIIQYIASAKVNPTFVFLDKSDTRFVD